MGLLEKKRAAAAGEAAPAKGKKRLSVKRVLALVLVLAVLAGAGLGVKALFFSADEKVAITGTTTYGSLATTIEGTGTTLPADSFTATVASSAGKITQVCVSAGESVTAGQLLYVQDDSELDEQLDDYQESIDDLYDQINNYNDQIDEYNDRIADLQQTISKLTVTAPFSGRLLEMNVEADDEVTRGTRLVTLMDDSKMVLTQYFSYAFEGDIYPGMSAGVSFPSLMSTFSGTVTDIRKVERITAEGTRCFAVTVTVDNPGALTEGMTGAAWLLADSGEKLYPAVEGELACYASKVITAEATGTVLSVAVSDYQRVNAGQLLLKIDPSDYEDQIKSAQKSIENARKNIETAMSRVETYRERMADIEDSRSDYCVTSDIDGRVITVGVREGETPRMAGMTSVMVYNLDTMQITANIDELDIDNIEMGMEVTIVKSGSSVRYTGYVSEISYEATNSSGVAYFPITISIPSNGEISAGVNVSYYITIGDNAEGVLAPINTLKSTDEGTCLFVKADSRPANAIDLEDGVVPDGFYAVPVEVGLTNSTYAVILSGVEADVEVFSRYQNAAPTGADTTSKGGEEETSGFPGGGEFGGGQMPNMGGGMPNMSGGNRGGMPNMGGSRP